MATTTLGAKAVGSIVKIKVDGTARDFIVVHQGRPSDIYDASCDGTWLLMKDIYEERQWHSSDESYYAVSTIHDYLNGTFLNLIDADIRTQIKQVKIPYRSGVGNDTTVSSGTNGLSTKVFLLGSIEVCFDYSSTPFGDGTELDYFTDCVRLGSDNKRVAYLNDSAECWWLRSSLKSSYDNYKSSHFVATDGSRGYNFCSNTFGIRPALILPFTLYVSDNGTVNANTAPSTPPTITVPATIHGGSTITVSWGGSTDAENNLEGYILERSTDGGSTWTQVYQGSSHSTTNSVAFGTASVMYRVKAYDSQGLASSYKTSSKVAVINNNAPSAPPSITVPNTVLGGATLTLTWGAASDRDGNLAGYSLERQVDGGAWAQIYSGNTLSYTDTITKGWASVAYRVRAYDSYNAYSDYAVSATRGVNNNTAPVIGCVYENGSGLGRKDADFAVAYTVTDADADTVTVTEEVDSAAMRTFTAALGADNSFEITGETFMKLLNGSHTLRITANDGRASTVYSLTFSKEITSASITLKEPMEADDQITICVLSVIGSIPPDAAYSVEVTNNGKDDVPVWEDCTNEVKTGANHIFENHTAANGFAFNFRVSVERGASGEGGYITSVQGGFQ